MGQDIKPGKDIQRRIPVQSDAAIIMTANRILSRTRRCLPTLFLIIPFLFLRHEISECLEAVECPDQIVQSLTEWNDIIITHLTTRCSGAAAVDLLSFVGRRRPTERER